MIDSFMEMLGIGSVRVQAVASLLGLRDSDMNTLDNFVYKFSRKPLVLLALNTKFDNVVDLVEWMRTEDTGLLTQVLSKYAFSDTAVSSLGKILDAEVIPGSEFYDIFERMSKSSLLKVDGVSNPPPSRILGDKVVPFVRTWLTKRADATPILVAHKCPFCDEFFTE